MKYVALLRGIGPGNPNMTNDKLRAVFEKLGYKNVRSVISSGNILFESAQTDQTAIESAIQNGLQTELGIAGVTIVRSEEAIKHIIQLSPFGGQAHSNEAYLTVTFLKNTYSPTVAIPFDSGKGYKVISYDAATNTLHCITDTTKEKTPALMTWLEKQYTKDITTRTYKTVERIAAKF